MNRALSAWLLFGMSSFVAVATGCWIAGQHGADHRVLLLNMAAWAAGAGIAAGISRIRNLHWWPFVAIAGIAATFLSPGMSGVHRWIALGVRFNAAELLLPSALITLAGQLLTAFALLVLLALQPDASQAIAFGGAMIVTMMASKRFWLAASLAAVAALSFLRADTLAPVPEVEGIILLATPLQASIAMLALVGTALAPLIVRSYSLTIYLALCALAPVFGAYPVPLVGMGVSPILGAWLGFGALMGSIRD
jgi:hypothetical protein